MGTCLPRVGAWAGRGRESPVFLGRPLPVARLISPLLFCMNVRSCRFCYAFGPNSLVGTGGCGISDRALLLVSGGVCVCVCRDQPEPSPHPLPCACARVLLGPGVVAGGGAGLGGGLCSADNCQCTALRSSLEPTGTTAFKGISPSSQGPSPTRLDQSPPGAPRRMGAREGLEEAPSLLLRVWLSSPPPPSPPAPSLSFPTCNWGCCPERTNCVWGRHILAGGSWRLLPQGCSNHPRSPPSSGPGPAPTTPPLQPSPTPTENPKSYCIYNSR